MRSEEHHNEEEEVRPHRSKSHRRNLFERSRSKENVNARRVRGTVNIFSPERVAFKVAPSDAPKPQK